MGYLINMVSLLLLIVTMNANAGFKCWTNNEGIRECGNSIPPEYAQKRSSTFSDSGIKKGVQERAKTDEELALEREQRKKDKELQKQRELERLAQQSYDRVLLATFLSPEEIIDAKDRKVAVIDGYIDLARVSITKLKQLYEEERKKAANIDRRGKKIPDDITEAINSFQEQISDKEKFILTKQEEKAELIKKYAMDYERFKALKGIK